MKKILALLLVLVMTIGLVPAVFADEPTNYTITINGTNKNHTYEAYQIFAGTLTTGEDDSKILTDIDWGSNIDTTQLTEVATLINTLSAAKSIAGYTNLTNDSPAADYAEAIADLKLAYKSDDAQAIADAFGEAITGTPAATQKVEGDATTCELTVNATGYYFIKDKDGSLAEAGTEAYTAYILTVVGDATVTAKFDVPTIEKKVDDINDTTGKHTSENGAPADATTWIDSADYDVGDAVPFKITVTTGEHIVDFSKYTMTIHDVQSPGLDKPTVFNVNLLGTDLTVTTTRITQNISDVNVTAEAVFETDDDCTFHIELTFESTDGKKLPNTLTNAKITVTYTAVLNEKAVIGSKGNPNETHLVYDNNPYDSKDKGETPKDKVIVFTYTVDVNKVTEKETPLAGATFSLWKKIAKPINVDTNSAYSKYEDATNPSLDDEVTYYKEDGEFIWVWLGTQEGEEKTEFKWDRIDDGIYKLVEEKAPNGYNKIDDIIFEVTADHDEVEENSEINLNELKAQSQPAGTATFDAKKDEGNVLTGVISTNVVNKSGSTLPSTGGIGTTIFYTVGGILVVAAVILLVTKKRMSAED